MGALLVTDHCTTMIKKSIFILSPFRIIVSFTDHSVAAKSGGCFPSDALVTTETGPKPMRDLRPGDRILALSSIRDGRLEFSEVLTFLDRDPEVLKLFYRLDSESGAKLTLTAAHLVFVATGNCSEADEAKFLDLTATFASDVRIGQCVLVGDETKVQLSRIRNIVLVTRTGVYAPLTQHGTMVIHGVAASCYAAVNRHGLAHSAFGPLRWWHHWTGSTGLHGNGVHWYAKVLHWVGRAIVDADSFHLMETEGDG